MKKAEWSVKLLVELCANEDDIRCGPFGTQLNKDEFRGTGIPLWGIKHVNSSFEVQTDEFVEPTTAKRLANYDIRPGDLVMTRKGTIGNCAVYPADSEPGIMHSDLLRLRLDQGLCDPAFLLYQLHHSPRVHRQLSLISGGAIMPGVNVGKLKKLIVEVPPLAEQKRLAGILNAADALRAKRREALAQLDTLLQSTFLDMFGECERPPISIGPPAFGRSSGFVLISSVARLATGHTPGRNVPGYWGGEIPWISLQDIRNLDGMIATSTAENVTQDGIDHSSSVKLPTGTVCFSRTASVGFATVMGREMATSQDFVNWVCSERLNPIYLMWALRLSRPYLLSKASGSTHKTIYYRDAEQFQVFVPSVELQTDFAAVVESVEQQKTRMRAHLAELDALFASLQSRAFNGEL